MWKISCLKQKIALTAAYLLIVALLYYRNVSCLYLQFFGVPCPGCGMTRAILAAMKLDFPAAFAAHPMFWSVPVLYAYFILDKGLLPSKRMNSIVLHIIGIGFLVQWIAKVVGY